MSPIPDQPQQQRLSKVVAHLVPCSRTEAEQYIVQGWVQVDGVTVEEPQVRVDSAQRVEVDPQAFLQPPLPVTILLHKPSGRSNSDAQDLLAASARWSGDTSGIRRLKSHSAGLAVPLPLPAPASGLTVFSQDGRMLRKLTDQASPVEQELTVEVTGTVSPGGLARLAGGMVYRGRPIPGARVSWQSEARLRIAAKGIALEVIPWMCEQVGLQVHAVKRIRIGRIAMAGLPAGQWRYLRTDEKF